MAASSGDSIRMSCPSCGATYQVALRLIGEEGTRFRCKRCRKVFRVHRPVEGPKPLTWVFTDDPAVQRSDILEVLRSEGLGERAKPMDMEARGAIVQLNLPQDRLPEIVIFGDMHVLLEDELLKRTASKPGIVRILLSTHVNTDLMDAAQAFCGYDHHMSLPLDVAAVGHLLQHVARSSQSKQPQAK